MQLLQTCRIHFVLLGIVAPVALGQFGQAGRVGAAPVTPRVGELSLRVGDVALDNLPNLRLAPPAEFEPDTPYVVQLNGPVTPQRRALLSGIGVELGDYLPAYAYVVRLSGVAPAALPELDFVQWVGAYRDEWKIDPEIGTLDYRTPERLALADMGDVALVITLFAGAAEAEVVDAIEGAGGTVYFVEPLAGNLIVSATLPGGAVAGLAGLRSVQYVEEAPEITLRNSTNRWIVQSNITNVTPLYGAGLMGQGQIVGILDGRLDVDHCSFSDANPIGPTHRKIEAYNTTLGADLHGTHVSGTAVGDAGADDNTRGVAYLGRLVFNIIPAFNETAVRGALITHHNQGARLHTNSWGNDGTTAYDSLARGFDSFSYDFEESLVCLAVTNTSTLKNPENAKNLLAVGASQDTPNQGNHCSGGTGPTSDGRRKPEIYAPGCSTNSSSAGTSCSTTALTGTSMASPAVAGTGLLVRQYYVDGFYPSGAANGADAFTPSGALIKATLLNSAVDMTGISGYPSNSEGWGRVLADDALFFTGETRTLEVTDVRNADGLSTGETGEQIMQVLGSGEELRVTLVWTDAPGSAGTSFAAVNDLDLEVIAPDATVYRGNVFSGGQSAPGGSKDDRNNVEQVRLGGPATGAWTVRVRGAAVNQDTQGYALVVSGEVLGEEPPFTISLPSGAPDTMAPGQPVSFDVVITAGTENIVPGSPALVYRYDGGSFNTDPLTPMGGDLYQAALPAAACSDTPEFYVTADGDGGTTRSEPLNAPANVFSASVGTSTVTLADNFEADLGWTVQNTSVSTGAWVRVVPTQGGTRGDPASDSDGSGMCFVTGNGTDEDLDGGPTRLISPVIDLSAPGAYTVSYARWFTNDDADIDRLDVEVSNGGPWTLVESVPGGSGWVLTSFNVRDFVTPNATVQVRFSATDNPNDSVTEAAIDAFEVSAFACDDGGGTPMDVPLASINVTVGTLVSGGVAEADASDDSYVVVDPELVAVNKHGTDVTVRGFSPVTTVSRLDVRVETGTNRTKVVTKIYLNDRDAGTWVQLDKFLQPQTDTVSTFLDVANPNAYVRDSDGLVRVRIFSRRGAVNPHQYRIDEVALTVVP